MSPDLLLPPPSRSGVADLTGQPLPGEADMAITGAGSTTIMAARHRGRAPSNPPPRRLPYLKVIDRFRLTVLCGIAWVAFSTWIAWPWIVELSHTVSMAGAIAIIAGIALIPGYLNVQLVTSLLMDHPSPIDFDFDYPAFTLLIAAYNEQDRIFETLVYALRQEYPASLRVIVIDDGSNDQTVSIARAVAEEDQRLLVVEAQHGGKAQALNAGLRLVRTPLVATIDADTLLMPGALLRIASRMLLAPDDTVAVAGSVLARNSRASMLAKAQEWDYFLGIGSIKRQQALLQATLVAQGAFSAYDAEALRDAGGWPNCIGEDIVMTWALLEKGGRTVYEPTAVAFTEVPVGLRSLARQRRRWARGMIEGLRTYGISLLRRHHIYAHSIASNIFFPYLDVTFTFVFIPGIVLAMFGDFAIVGPMTLAVLPLNMLLASVMYRRQHRSFAEVGLLVRRNLIGFGLYVFCYQLIMSPASVAGYAQELLRLKRRW
jgi:biofilm PGA synthesis N-glycosyltransferase PgaC